MAKKEKTNEKSTQAKKSIKRSIGTPIVKGCGKHLGAN